ncbi:ATP synthase subunit s, mitochondrial-like [Mercenaria mercenaria]|uniref:ATP synthase subunit s, mitochondrial-like n=1 Tax=Mercenaria mercenaria TaxID=6596 RepID=UPI00234F941B|nr:ATP synthase subunit s, mitochondrial-like [Mercenaria mercenaria]
MMLHRFSRFVHSAALLVDVGKISSIQPQTYQIRRHFFKYLNRALNIFDRERYEEVGGDRLCAEWVLKCGGRLRWAGSHSWLSDYNSLPSESTEAKLNVQDVDVSGTVVMSQGFEHFWYVKNLKSLKLHDCKYVDDNCLKQLQITASTLEHLQISANKQITDTGLLHLVELVCLTDLHLKDLPKVKDKKETYEKLQKALPNCDIMYPDLENV